MMRAIKLFCCSLALLCLVAPLHAQQAPNAVTRYEIGFPANDHVFLKGHKIMVQVQSTWFPVIDRNPQRFVPNIFLAKESDFQRATQRVFRSGRQASYVAVPVVEAARQQ
jgi:hypothetical protein